jgi:hypothetical protein
MCSVNLAMSSSTQCERTRIVDTPRNINADPTLSAFIWPEHPYYSTFHKMSSSQLDSQDNVSLFESELILSTPLESTSDETPEPFTITPDKRHALWDEELDDIWQAWWERKFKGSKQYAQFKSVSWSKPKRAGIWKSFYQAVEIKNGLPKVICRYCSMVYTHPEVNKGGSKHKVGGTSTSTLSRHITKCQKETEESEHQS